MQIASQVSARLLRDNWSRVSTQVAQCCHKVGRPPQSVQIVAASKYVGADLAWQLAEAGCQFFGENRPQSLWEKVDYFSQHSSSTQDDESPLAVQWHMIGHLQRNKITRTLPLISLLHSLDSLRLAQALNREADSLGRRLPVLLELNITADTSKTGMSPIQVEELFAELDNLPGLELCGLMAMSSQQADEYQARKEFEQVRQWRDRWQQSLGDKAQLRELSMGMSNDYPAAIAAGSTLVRIGSSLWQGLL